MAKYVVFSFDDGRRDTYEVASPIMNKYGISATINIVSDYVQYNNKEMKNKFENCDAMTRENVVELYKTGFEIACHGATHKNEARDLKENIEAFKEWGVYERTSGFASPYSFLTKTNADEIIEFIKNGKLTYIRSGVQVRRESFIYKVLYYIQEKTKNSFLFYTVNKRMIYPIERADHFILGVSITNKTSFKQIKYLLKKMPEESFVVLILHSLSKDNRHKEDRWCWSASNFENLCAYIKTNRIVSLRNKDVFQEGSK